MIAGFRAKNHPQQTKRRGALDSIDDRRTPPALFEALHREFAFTVDAAASIDNAKLARFWTRMDNALSRPWNAERVWCNPPYSNLGAWTRKAHEEPAALAVMLLPANRTEQPWWQSWVEPHRDRGTRLSTRFLPGRARFSTRTNPTAHYASSAPFGLVVLVWQKEH